MDAGSSSGTEPKGRNRNMKTEDIALISAFYLRQ